MEDSIKRRIVTVLCVCLLVFGCIKTPAAEELTWQIRGFVYFVNPSLKHIFSIGDAVTYTFTFETDTIDSAPSTSSRGAYKDAIIDSEIIVGTYKATLKNYTIETKDNFNSGYDLITLSGSSANTVLNGSNLVGADGKIYSFDGIFGYFMDRDRIMLTSDSLPADAREIMSHADKEIFNVQWVWGVYGRGSVAVNNIQLTDITCGVTDTDDDGYKDLCDNCPNKPNADQADSDYDGVGDACDVCPDTADDQYDSDSDGVGEPCDNCPTVFNPDQIDYDEDGIGNVCDEDVGGDGSKDPSAVEPSKEGPAQTCYDGIDNDGDGAVDCVDADCSKNMVCRLVFNKKYK
ncbi:MAG TPA: thrombospondin type 3 repeat-containing protein [Desulfobulbales bacterium]|nr:thrombospondin type 3 repeat-containing protein [Desulfobulbales bacterium]